MVVTETGMATQMGQIAYDIQSIQEGTSHFQREVGQLGRRLTLIIGALIAIIALVQLTVSHFSLLETFLLAMALAVAAIPEGLPVVLTLAHVVRHQLLLKGHATGPAEAARLRSLHTQPPALGRKTAASSPPQPATIAVRPGRHWRPSS